MFIWFSGYFDKTMTPVPSEFSHNLDKANFRKQRTYIFFGIFHFYLRFLFSLLFSAIKEKINILHYLLRMQYSCDTCINNNFKMISLFDSRYFLIQENCKDWLQGLF